jgi:hypothetical protein
MVHLKLCGVRFNRCRLLSRRILMGRLRSRSGVSFAVIGLAITILLSLRLMVCMTLLVTRNG